MFTRRQSLQKRLLVTMWQDNALRLFFIKKESKGQSKGHELRKKPWCLGTNIDYPFTKVPSVVSDSHWDSWNMSSMDKGDYCFFLTFSYYHSFINIQNKITI